MKKFKELIKTIKELAKNPRGRGILFFAGYFIFFLIIIVVFRFCRGTPIIKGEYEKGNPYKYKFSSIMSNNYEYKYVFIKDEVTTTIEGKKNKDKELFKIGQNNYYKNEENYFTEKNGVWIKCDNPYIDIFNYVLDANNLEKILKDSYYISKTNYESGKETYNFLISTNNLNFLIKDSKTDIDDVSNEIVLSTDEDLYVNEIKLKATSYGEFNKLCVNSLNIELYFNNYGKIEEIESPI